jgi:hypothetical protein
MATKKVVNKKVVEFPLDQIGYETIYKFITNIDELARVLDKAIYSKDSFEKFRRNFFEAYKNIKENLIVYRDRLGNILTKEQLSGEIPNSWVAIAKEKGVSRLPLPKNEYDDKLAELEAKEKECGYTKLNCYYGDWGIVDREDWIDEVLEAWGAELEYTIERIPWYKKLWNYVRRAI